MNTTIDWEVRDGRPAAADVQGSDLDRTCEWLRENREAIRAGLDEHGAVYLRGLPIKTVEDFAEVRDALVSKLAGYVEKATPRSHFGKDVYSSTDLPPSHAIRPHNENSYALSFPGILMFGCLVAPDEGGATPVTDVRKVLRDIPAPLAARFREHGWSLVRNYGEHISLGWRTAFATEDRDEVAAYCADNHIAHEWVGDDQLRTRQRRSAVIRHPGTGEEVWFNHTVFWNEWALDPDVREVFIDDLGHENLPFNTAYGDGEPISREDIETIDEAYRRATVRETWQVGDILIVDNILSAHAREAFKGQRKIVVAMGDPIALSDCSPTVQPLAGFAEPAKSAVTAAAPAAQDAKPAKRRWFGRRS
ncbi:TauD/TfdA family dioxygenase [Streptosporangium sp. NPDC004379]|uniref:TauD/TfdA family dioxygenase n=1 Tax=Streptosporangium sp. NPDC004379 TaxID=3366189 RepID=UPI003688FB00